MASQPIEVASLPSPKVTDDVGEVAATVSYLRVAALEQRVAELEAELERERERRQAVVDRYERLLEDR